MSPFTILGVPSNCSVEDAKQAYRRLAQHHHPDKGGSEETFKKIKAAFEQIERGYRDAPTIQPPPQPSASTFKPGFGFAGKPAPGYEEKKTRPVLPITRRVKNGSQTETHLRLEITETQAFEGCNVPFWHDGNMHDFLVLPGSNSRREKISVSRNPLVGMMHQGYDTVVVELVVTKKQQAEEEKTRDAVLDLQLCALGLFTGGKFTVTDHLGAPVTVTVPVGHDFRIPLKIKGHGYGTIRGDLVVNIIPIFKPPITLSESERDQLSRLNEMAMVTK